MKEKYEGLTFEVIEFETIFLHVASVMYALSIVATFVSSVPTRPLTAFKSVIEA